MSPNLLLAFELTLAGMGLVFGSILLFWGLMAALVRITAERLQATGVPAPAETDRRRLAAAVAVASLLAFVGHETPKRVLQPGRLSAWRAVARIGRH